MLRSLLAKGGILRRANPRGEPNTSLLVEHRVVHASLAVPDDFVPPVRRRRRGVILGGRRLWIAYRHPDLSCLVIDRVQDRKEISALLRSSKDQAVGVD